MGGEDVTVTPKGRNDNSDDDDDDDDVVDVVVVVVVDDSTDDCVPRSRTQTRAHWAAQSSKNNIAIGR